MATQFIIRKTTFHFTTAGLDVKGVDTILKPGGEPVVIDDEASAHALVALLNQGWNREPIKFSVAVKPVYTVDLDGPLDNG